MVKQKKQQKAEEILSGDEIIEVENPYTVTNRSIDELVSPKDTMFYLSKGEIQLILGAYFISELPKYFGEDEVSELKQYATMLKHYLVSKGGRGRRDILRVLRASSGQVRENVNKSVFKQLLQAGRDVDLDEE